MENVPNEVLTQIIESLEEDADWELCCSSPLDTDPFLANLRNVRLVCRGFKAAAAHIFGETYFSCREVILEKSSLETLRSIAKHKELCKFVTHLTVNTYQFPAELTEWSTFRSHISREVANEHATFLNTADEEGITPLAGVRALMAHAAYKRFYKNQKKAKASGAYTAMLAESLECLKKGSTFFRSLSISGHNHTPALRYIIRKIGLGSFQWFTNMWKLVTEATCMILQAIYWSRVKFCSLTLEHCGEEQLLLPPRALKHLKAMKHIHHLSLELRTQAVDEDGDSCVNDIVRACPNIQQLDIMFPGFVDFGLADVDMFFGSKRLQFLKRLHLSGFALPVQGFANMLYRHRKTLKCLELYSMILSTGHWISIFKFLHDHLKLEDFDGHNLYESGMRNYHRPEGELQKYILGKSKDVDWAEVEENYSKVANIEEGMLILASAFGFMPHPSLMDDLFGDSFNAGTPELVTLEIIDNDESEEDDSNSEIPTTDDDSESSDDSDDPDVQVFLQELSDHEIEEGDEDVDIDDEDP